MIGIDSYAGTAETSTWNFITQATGTYTWTNATNAAAFDGSYATMTTDNSSAGGAQSLIGYNFGLALPSSAIIIGIEVEVKMQQKASGNGPLAVRLLKDRSAGSSSDISTDFFYINGIVANSDRLCLAGSPTSNWTGWSTAGTAITYSDLNSSNFGIAITSVGTFGGYNPKVDSIKIRIQYTTTASSVTSCGTGATSGGTAAWSNPGNITASDNTYATQAVTSTPSSNAYLNATNFGFAIGSDKAIDSIKVEIERNKSAGVLVYDDTVQLILAGTRIGSNMAGVSAWNSTDSYISYTFNGTSLSYTDVNTSTFGVSIRAKSQFSTSTINVDHVRMTVYYSDSTPPAKMSMMGIGL